jgi:hypothetical protein
VSKLKIIKVRIVDILVIALEKKMRKKRTLKNQMMQANLFTNSFMQVSKTRI